MRNKVKFKGEEKLLQGRMREKGELVGGFNVVGPGMEPVKLEDLKDSIKVFTTFLSLDTPVCDNQVKEFNKRAAELSDKVSILAVSMDLPFAQKRFCRSNEIDRIKVASDYKGRIFGFTNGLFVKEMELLARALMIADKNNVIRYLEVAEEMTDQLDYEKGIEAIKDVLDNPAVSGDEERSGSRCTPCEKGTPPISEEKLYDNLNELEGWGLVEGKKITRSFKFKSFSEAKRLVDIIAALAQTEGHHPDICISYNKVDVELTTHASGGLTENDFIMARNIDKISV